MAAWVVLSYCLMRRGADKGCELVFQLDYLRHLPRLLKRLIMKLLVTLISANPLCPDPRPGTRLAVTESFKTL